MLLSNTFSFFSLFKSSFTLKIDNKNYWEILFDEVTTLTSWTFKQMHNALYSF